MGRSKEAQNFMNTLVLEGELTVRTIEKTFYVKAGQSIITYPERSNMKPKKQKIILQFVYLHLVKRK